MPYFTKPIKTTLLAAAICSIPGLASADAFFNADVVDPTTTYSAATNWKQHVTTSNPNGSQDCLTNGFHISANKDGTPNSITVNQVPPLFSKSNSRERYLTLCQDNKSEFVTIRMKTSLTSCAMWVCNTGRERQVMSHNGTFGVTWPSNSLLVIKPPFK